MKSISSKHGVGKNDFSFFIPVEAISKGTDKDGKRWIQGIASTPAIDLQGETVSPSGIDYGYFLKHGYINDDHKSGPEHKVGEPTEARITSEGLWIKGFLYKGKERADYWWEHLNALAQSDSNRKVGFSIQGKIQRRNGNAIAKCWLQDVAITASPVNTQTWAEIVKSLSNQQWCLHPWVSNKDCDCCKGVGSCPSPGPAGEILSKDDEEDEEKAMSTANSMSLIPQSLEGSAKVQTYKSLNRISYEDAIQLVQLEQGHSRVVAKAIVDSIFVTHGIQ